MMELEVDNASNSHDNTWQCWMVNTRTGEEQLIAYGYALEEECLREATSIFEKWQIDLYPTSEGWAVVYRQDSRLKMAQYWRDYYQALAKVWSDRYEEISRSYKQDNQQLPQTVQQRLYVAQPKRLARRQRVKLGASILGHRYKRLRDIAPWVGRLVAGTLLWAIAFEVIALITNPSKDKLFIAQHSTDIPLSIRKLFTSKKAPGSIAIG